MLIWIGQAVLLIGLIAVILLPFTFLYSEPVLEPSDKALN